MSKEIIFSKATDKEILEFLSQVKTDENGVVCNLEYWNTNNTTWMKTRFEVRICLMNDDKYRIKPVQMPGIGSKWLKGDAKTIYQVYEISATSDISFLVEETPTSRFLVEYSLEQFYNKFKPYQEPECEYVPYTFETFHPHRDRFYYYIALGSKHSVRVGKYAEGSIDDMTWEYAFENLKWENGEPFGQKLAVKS